MSQLFQKINLLNELFEKFKRIENKSLKTTIFVLSYGTRFSRCNVKEFYGKNIEESWKKLSLFFRTLSATNEYIRIDLITEETLIAYEELVENIRKINRNNYIPFGIRIEGKKKRVFLKEELTANALIVPDKNHKVGKNPPNLSFNLSNYKNYVNKKYNAHDYTMEYYSISTIYTFQTKAFFIEKNTIIHELKDYGFGNQFRLVSDGNLFETLDIVIKNGANYLSRQVKNDGDFTYGYFPCYDKSIKGYNSVRHFSSLYALLEAAEILKDDQMIHTALKGLNWGLENLSITIDECVLIKEPFGTTMEFKLGAQALAILALAKYTEITKDPTFHDIMKSLIYTIEKKFITEDQETIHVLDEQLNTKASFRIIYYDGEALFSLLRAYELLKDEKILSLCKKMISYYIEQKYERYRDHWLSYAVNEFLKHEQTSTYYRFGMSNALDRIDFMEKRDTAYPTMAELLVAASKMMIRLENYEKRDEVISPEEFQASKNRIFEVMNHRIVHQLVTGTMFPEFAMFFKSPYKISYGFFARHDRFRMRIDDAEHFLSGFVNYRSLVE